MEGRSHASPEPDTARERPSTGSAGREKLEETLALGQQALAFLAQLADLLRLEAMLAVQSLPRMAALWLLTLPLALLTWVSFAVLVSWGVYTAVQWPLAGFATFFGLNLLALVVAHLGMRKHIKRMSFRETRQQLRATLGGINEELSKTRQTKEPANDP